MVIHKYKSYEEKGDQQWEMVVDCSYHWSKLNDANFSHYTNIMNMKTRKYNGEHNCWIALTYHLKPNKW